MQESFTKHQRVAILIDSANIFMTSREIGVRVDYSKVLERLNGRQIVRAVFFHVEADGDREAGFLRVIRGLGFEIRTKRLRVFADGNAKANQDVDIAVEAASLAEKCDVITLVTGDGDFTPLVHYLRARGVKTEVMAFARNASRELREVADEFFPITGEMFLEAELPAA